MDVKINSMGSGACPLCKLNNNCLIHASIRKALVDINEPDNEGLDVCIYGCPRFEEINT